MLLLVGLTLSDRLETGVPSSLVRDRVIPVSVWHVRIHFYEILSYSLLIDVREILPVLAVEGQLPVKDVRAEELYSRHVRHLEHVG